jgi:Peptidase family M28/PDZ domain/Peptidase family M1 domain
MNVPRPLALLALAAALFSPALAAPPIHHALRVDIDPVGHRIAVEDTITSPAGTALPDLPEDALPFDVAHAARLDARTIRLRYAATIDHPISREGEDYARGFAETEGTIQAEGVFLGGTSRWYASYGDDGLVTFDLDVTLPPGWDAMSQGKRVVHDRADTGTHVRFTCDDPQEEIWLTAGPWVETDRDLGGLDGIAMLRTKDDGLAAKYLDATGPYVSMYAKLLGPYPYSKFALVENFWETGYGMPSFTLLGPTVIRLPFIITTSYPHEILHNWWGNGVYVDPSGGNWSEGLTAYLADHLFAEQKGGGAAYRQEALQKYADYASHSKDFPLTAFRERHSAATEAVGYGKALMLFHMVRRRIGDAAFVSGLRAFYAEHRFVRAGFGDLRRAFEKASGRDLAKVFDPWVERAGAPRLAVRDVVVRQGGPAWQVTGTIEQTQDGEPYALDVPVAVTIDRVKDAWQGTIGSNARSATFTLDLPTRPLRLDVDPQFDLFRVLDPAEIPPALSGAFGADKALMVLPSKAGAELLAAYRAMAEEWNHGRTTPMRVVLDSEIEDLPKDEAVWLVGFENRFLAATRPALAAYGADLDTAGMKVPETAVARDNHAVALALRRDGATGPPLAFVAADRAAQVAGLARKLPHYHKYSYLAFEGDEPQNVAKGRWPVVGSPLSVALDPGRPLSAIPMAKLAARHALAELPPAYSKERMQATVNALASPAMKGRGLGTPELDRAAATIADAMREAGLEPAGGTPGSFFQDGTATIGGREVPFKNVVGALGGANPAFADQTVVVGAHYDHLGIGAGGRIQPGADDNASGVAVLLELARQMAASGPLPRRVLFVAFSGEEEGLLGSQRFVATRPAGTTTFAMVNMDTVGRLGGGKILVLGAGSADEWIHIVNGAGYVTGAPVLAVMNDPGGSDQKSFLSAGVPAVQIFTGANSDYHTPNDTPDKIDGDGLVEVAAVTREIVAYLAERDTPLTSHAGGLRQAPPPQAAGPRRASLGTVPDYAYDGRGVRISGTTPDSPAEKAGLLAGDVILKLGDTPVGSLADFSNALKSLAPGARVTVTFTRNGAQKSVDVTLGSRQREIP